ncbi:MAG: hypothetical protein AAGU27_07380 [Dehalobacterium sp.]
MTTNVIPGVKVLKNESKSLNSSSPVNSGNNIFTAIYFLAKEIIIMAKAISETRKRFYHGR